jgi:hypothetical protein
LSDDMTAGGHSSWFMAVIESCMEETGMSREEAEEWVNFELLFGGALMAGYAAKAKAARGETEKSRAPGEFGDIIPLKGGTKP